MNRYSRRSLQTIGEQFSLSPRERARVRESLSNGNIPSVHANGVNDIVMRISGTAAKIASLLPLLVAFTASAKPSAPVGLLVNGASNPLAIDRDATRFTWMSKDTERGEFQTAYQIQVVSSQQSRAREQAGQATHNSGLIFWDSGKVNSDQSASVEYTGPALPATTRFWWKVRIWDQTGQTSAYSAPAYFDTGLNQGEWAAKYIWDGTTNSNNFVYFRKTFVVKNKPDLAKVYVTAHNDYLLYFNGQLLGRGPARCDPY
ncbi:MAG TPA: hypothetical protein VGV18_07385, partial [Verrucomicrobiae bacterium]|nr:hypothetical protein [Verrucomicrobiae bacterium]